jgi:hypothetical protein
LVVPTSRSTICHKSSFESIMNLLPLLQRNLKIILTAQSNAVRMAKCRTALYRGLEESFASKKMFRATTKTNIVTAKTQHNGNKGSLHSWVSVVGVASFFRHNKQKRAKKKTKQKQTNNEQHASQQAHYISNQDPHHLFGNVKTVYSYTVWNLLDYLLHVLQAIRCQSSTPAHEMLKQLKLSRACASNQSLVLMFLGREVVRHGGRFYWGAKWKNK